jgi:hypothetical protein
MAEHLRHEQRGNPGLGQPAGESMPEVVDPEIFEPGGLQGIGPSPAEVPQMSTRLLRVRKDVLGELRAQPLPPLSALMFFGP